MTAVIRRAEMAIKKRLFPTLLPES